MHFKLVAILTLSACSSAPETSTSEAQIGDGSCPFNICGNSNELSHGGLHEASLDGTPDHHGFSIQTREKRAQLVKNGVSYDLNVVNAQLSGESELHGKLQGSDLVGAELVIEREGKSVFAIHIANVRSFDHLFGLGTVEAYRLLWRPIDAPLSTEQTLCNDTDPGDPVLGEVVPLWFGMRPGEVVIFEGERFDVERLRVGDQLEPEWINFGCAKHTLAKMFLLRETIAQNPARDWAGAQATFNMLVGRYCGGTTSLTVPGVPLVWKGGVLDDYLEQPIGVEARWNEDGATCLGTPRLAVHHDQAIQDAHFGGADIATAIADACGGVLPPPCDPDLASFDGALRVSANWEPKPE